MSVVTAIPASVPMIRYLRLYLSAQTPPIKEIRNCGSKPAIEKAATHIPDEVNLVAYHITDIWTSVEPNSEMPWLIKNNAAFSATP